MSNRRRLTQSVCTLLFAAAALSAGCTFDRQFAPVREGVLYRGSQPSPSDLHQVCRSYGIRTIVRVRSAQPTLFGKSLDMWQSAENEYAVRNGIRLVEVPLDSGEPPSTEQLAAFFKLIDDPQARPILVHCLAGIERSAVFAAAYRVRCDGWTPARAVEEMKSFGYNRLIWPRQQDFVESLPAVLLAMEPAVPVTANSRTAPISPGLVRRR